MNIYIAQNEQQTGPFTLEDANKKIAAGTVQPTDLAWHEGLVEWQALSTINGILLPSPQQRIHQAPTIPRGENTFEHIVRHCAQRYAVTNKADEIKNNMLRDGIAEPLATLWAEKLSSVQTPKELVKTSFKGGFTLFAVGIVMILIDTFLKDTFGAHFKWWAPLALLGILVGFLILIFGIIRVFKIVPNSVYYSTEEGIRDAVETISKELSAEDKHRMLQTPIILR
ncbi:MAG: DUF4339 domain-containing protein [Candidatus Kapaibacterium sp.]|nr:MAG: DUF4339 domain-containing protein [Candidatus Kapabacteria bacterium]